MTPSNRIVTITKLANPYSQDSMAAEKNIENNKIAVHGPTAKSGKLINVHKVENAAIKDDFMTNSCIACIPFWAGRVRGDLICDADSEFTNSMINGIYLNHVWDDEEN